MEKVKEGLWQKKVSLGEGDVRVNYVFIVDGEWMTADNPSLGLRDWIRDLTF